MAEKEEMSIGSGVKDGNGIKDGNGVQPKTKSWILSFLALRCEICLCFGLVNVREKMFGCYMLFIDYSLETGCDERGSEFEFFGEVIAAAAVVGRLADCRFCFTICDVARKGLS